MKKLVVFAVLILGSFYSLHGYSQDRKSDSLYITEGFLNKYTLQKAGVPHDTYSIKQAVLDMNPQTEAYSNMKKALNYERTGKALFWAGAVVGITYVGIQISGTDPAYGIIYGAFGAIVASYPFYLLTKSQVKKAVIKYNSSAGNNNKASLHWQLNSNGVGLALKF